MLNTTDYNKYIDDIIKIEIWDKHELQNGLVSKITSITSAKMTNIFILYGLYD